MATLIVQDLARTGIDFSTEAATLAGDEFVNDGNTALFVDNGSGSTLVVTVASQYSNPPVGTIADDVTVSIPDGESRWMAPFPKSGYNDANSKVQVTYDSVTSVTVGVMSLGSTIER